MYDGIEELRKIQVEMLLFFDKICRENNLNYQLCAGTLLGSIRHKGFIPWDDDIDVSMLRKDYEDFLDIYKNNENEKYFLQNYKTDENSMFVYSRIRRNNTLIHKSVSSELDMHRGIFIDIFPLDKVIPDKSIGKIQKQMLFIIKKLKRAKAKNIAKNSNNQFTKIIKLIIHYMLKPVSTYNLGRIHDSLAHMSEKQDAIYSTHLGGGNNNHYYAMMIKNEEFYDTIKLEFEGHLFSGPRNYHEVLTNHYGDYMKYPPIEEQKPHHGIIEVIINED